MGCAYTKNTHCSSGTPNELGASCFCFLLNRAVLEGKTVIVTNGCLSRAVNTQFLPDRGQGKRNIVSIKGFYAEHQ